MKTFFVLFTLFATATAYGNSSQTETVLVSSLDLKDPADAVSITNVVCQKKAYTLTSTLSPRSRRPTAIILIVRDPLQSTTIDITTTELGRLLTDKNGLSELSFGCAGDILYIRHHSSENGKPEAKELFRVEGGGLVKKV